MYKVAYLASHPIQYQVPLLRLLSKEKLLDLDVFFCSELSLHEYQDPGFGAAVKWDVPLLEGYRSEFLPAFGPRTGLSAFRPFNYGLYSRLKNGNYDALWVHGFSRPYYLYAMCIAKMLGIRVLLRDETSELSSQRSGVRKYLKKGFMSALTRVVDGFLAIGSKNAEYYRTHGVSKERIFLVPYTVDNDFFATHAANSSDQCKEIRQSLNMNADLPVILYAGKFIERKRPIDLLESYAAIVDKENPHAYLLFVGDGETRNAVEARAQTLGATGVKFLGFKNQSELPAYYQLSDIFVLPAFNEPWGLVVNEVMNANCAIIVSDQVVSGYDLVREGENGFVFTAGDCTGLSRCLEECLADKDRLEEMGNASRRIIADWGYQQSIDGVLLALQSLCDEKLRDE